MKKLIIILAFFAISHVSNAQSLLGGLLDSTFSKGSLTSVLEDLAGGLVDKLNLSVTGTWEYSQPEVKFKSDSFLAEAGSSVASGKLEKSLAKIYLRVGLDKDFVYTFNEDLTFAQQVKLRGKVFNLSGTYKLDKENKIIVFNYTAGGLVGVGKISAIYANTGKSLALMFDAKQMLSITKKIVSMASSFSGRASLITLDKLIKNYDGMLLGYKMNKK